MKILILSSEFEPFRGGIGTYAQQMALAAAELGHSVTVLAADYGGEGKVQTSPYRVLRYPGGQHSMRDIPAKIALVRRLARQEADFDIVHAADWPFYIPLAMSSYRGRSRCLLTFHGSEVTFMRHPIRALPLAILDFWNGWAECIANSRDTAARLSAAFRPPDSAVRIVHPGVGREWLSARVDRSKARGMLGIAGERFVIVSLGRVVRRKGYDLLFDALSRLPQEIVARMEWHIVGPMIDMAYAKDLRDRVALLPCRVIMTGSLPQGEAALRLSAADLFCLPGQRLKGEGIEGFGLAFVEAGALGLPSLATDIGGIVDAIAHGESGMLVAENDVPALAAALLRLYRHPSERARLGDGALRRAKASGWTRTATETYGGGPPDSGTAAGTVLEVSW